LKAKQTNLVKSTQKTDFSIKMASPGHSRSSIRVIYVAVHGNVRFSTKVLNIWRLKLLKVVFFVTP